MKFLLTFALGLVALSVEAVLEHYFNSPIDRFDATVAIIAFLALRSNLVGGAFASFTLGYLLDMMSGRPMGLYTFLGVLTFLVARLADSVLEIRSRFSFMLFAMGADLGHHIFAAILNWLTSVDSPGVNLSLSGLFMEAALTGVAAILIYPLLTRVSPASDRAEPGLLR